MKKSSFLKFFNALFVCLVFFSSVSYASSKTIKVLFIGNSLTSANNLPNMVAEIAKSKGFNIIYNSHTLGGARLANHASNPKVYQKIKNDSWDFVVFQEQSQ